jgi:hypothetical protein
MPQTFDPREMPLEAIGALDLCRSLVADKQRLFTIPLADGPVIMKAKWLAVNIFGWRSLVLRGMPIYQRHTIHGGLVTAERLANLQTEIYNDVVALAVAQHGLVPPEVDRAILEDLCRSVINDLHRLVVTQLGEYHLSISAFELADLMLHPKIAALTMVDVRAELLIGVEATEKKIEMAGKQMVEALKDRSLPSNVLVPFLELGQLNTKQLAQVTTALGYRVDASSSYVRKPVLSSYMRGIRSIVDYAIESLMAKMTIYYNKSAMPDSQYSSRKQQLLSAGIHHLYPGDCGSTATIPFYVNKNNARNVLTTYIVDKGQLVCLSPENINAYIGTTVELRLAPTCRHTDGICHVCGGRLTDFMPPWTHVGIAATIEYMGEVAQLVLGAKHFTTTKALSYQIPEALRGFLVVKQNDIYVREDIDTNRMRIGVAYEDIRRIRELITPQDDAEATAIDEQQFSNITWMIIADGATGTLETPEVSMITGGAVPYFSSEVLAFIDKHPKNVSIADDIVWISMKGFSYTTEPLMRYVLHSSSMIQFVQDLTKFATSSVRNYTSLPAVLEAFSLMVSREVNVPLTYLGIVLKSYLITNDDDYNVPIVTDVNNVKFGTLMSIMPRRSLGGLFAFERLSTFMASEPELYLLPHKYGVFDAFFYDFTDEIELLSGIVVPPGFKPVLPDSMRNISSVAV